MSQTMKDLHLFMLFLIMEAIDKESCGVLSICMTALTMMSIEDDLHRMRPSNFYPPENFYPDGAYDAFWARNEELFFNKFRFRLSHLHRMSRAMGLEVQHFICGAERNICRTDVF
jgi:hypothetical protein